MKYDKLIKILMLTQSDHDGEALSAIRMANGMLKAAGHNWESFLKTIQAPAPIVDPTFGDIADIFSSVMNDIFSGKMRQPEPAIPAWAAKLSNEQIMSYFADLLQEYDGTSTGMQVYKLKKAYVTRGKLSNEEWQIFTSIVSGR